MTDEKFTELVNLYLDKEISAEDLKLLEAEITASSARNQAFTSRCRLHRAMRMALKPERSRSGKSRSRSSSRSGKSRSSSRSGSRRSSSNRSRSSSRPSTRIAEFEDLARASGGSGVPRWLLLSGMAASVALGFLLLSPVFKNTTDPSAQPELVGVTQRELSGQDPLASLGRSELRRFASAQQQREVKYHASLISQMRLLGLRPEHTPEDKQLKEVDLAAVYKPTQRVSQAEVFQRIQELKAMPDQKLLLIEEADTATSPSWSKAFDPIHSNVIFEEL